MVGTRAKSRRSLRLLVIMLHGAALEAEANGVRDVFTLAILMA